MARFLLPRTSYSVLAYTEWMGVIRSGYITQKQTLCPPIVHAMYLRIANPSGVVMGAIPTNKGPLGTPGEVGHQFLTSSKSICLTKQLWRNICPKTVGLSPLR